MITKPADRAISRRDLLQRSAHGFGALALAALLAEDAGARSDPSSPRDPLAPRAPHHHAKARSIIFLYMDGGPSQVDTFDPKPRLERENGEPIKLAVPPTQFIPHDSVPKVLGSPWQFQRHGQSGLPVSDLLPETAGCADDLCVIRSMVSDFSEHASANLFLHSGMNQQGRPSLGAWVTYGLGSECRDLPGFVVLKGGVMPAGGLDNFHSGFLPAEHQGTFFKDADTPVANLKRTEATDALQRGKLDLMRQLDRSARDRLGGNPLVEAAVANYELAFRMQTAVPNLLDLQGESADRQLYGVDDPTTRTFGTQCLLARRLVERGVRFIELMPPAVPGANRWDSHNKLKEGHEKMARATDLPIAGLLRDLKARGLLGSTLVFWGGEFGRTPVAQGTSGGRDHNPYGFTIWLAGGGVRGGMAYGATDEYGFRAVENKVHIHDLHATLLHLLGLDHKRLTFRFGGRDVRLTDVHGEVVHAILT